MTARRLRALRVRVAHGIHFLRMPRAVVAFYVRAWSLRGRLEDAFSLGGATKPRDLATVLTAAGDARLAVEVGTGTGWTAIALALACPTRRVISFDPVHRPERDRYLELVSPGVAERIEFVEQAGELAPEHVTGVDFLFIDAAHDAESTSAAFQAWRDRLSATATVAFHDFGDPRWPGVTQAIRSLGLRGTARHRVFVWRAG